MYLDGYNSAVVYPSENGFSSLDTSVCSFAVSLQDVSSYVDGVRVRLHIGNLTTATVNGGTFQVKWGLREPPMDNDYATKFREWKKSLREKSVDFRDTLRVVSWNHVTPGLTGMAP